MTMASEPRGMAPEPAPAADLATFQRLLALSTKALDALENGEFDAVQSILVQREEMIQAAATGGALGTGSGRSEGELLRAARQLEHADARLTLAVASARDEIARDLAELENGGAARSAYGPTGRAKSAINVVR